MREIEAIRDRIDGHLAELGDALPPRDELVRRVAIAAASGLVAVLSLWFVAHRIKVSRQDARVRRLVKEAIASADAERAERAGR